MSNIVLRMKGITKKFHAVTALNDVNIDLFEGEVLALVGENGAGKSTLMKILSGSYPSNSYDGEVEVNGKKVYFITTSDAEKNGIEMIYQEISLNPELSVAENMFIGRLPRMKVSFFVDWKKIRQLCGEALEFVGLDVDPNEIVRKLSTSQQQLISIAKALYKRPKLLVLDEPTSALTETETQKLMGIIRGLRDHRISCIYISHKLEEVFNIADRVTILRDGRVISTYKREEIVPKKVIEDIVGRKIEKMYPKVNVPTGKTVLKIENFTIPSRMPGKNIVENVSFTLKAGEILGLGGLVGAGRSELINAIFGSGPKNSGKIYIKGQEVNLKGPKDAIRYGMGLLTEDRRVSGFVGTMSIRENISLASFWKIFGRLFIKSRQERILVEEYSRQLNIKTPSIETSVLNLSGGNQQKVVLAKWLMTDVKILFLDEPTKGIDVGSKVEIYNIMTELVKAGVAIVMISSELPELLAMSDRLIVLAMGGMNGEFRKEELTHEAFMKAATGIH